MNTSMDISKLCRSCMKEVASWERGNFDDRVIDMFCFSTNLVVTNDNIPKQFCYDCVIKIESTYTYITQAQRVDATLKNIASRLNTSVIQRITTEHHPKSNNVKHSDTMNLTLPDYKICATIDGYNEKGVCDSIEPPFTETEDVDTIETIDNVENNEKSLVVNNDEVEQSKNSEIEKLNESLAKVEDKKKVCSLCTKAFTSTVWFNKHMKKEHAEHKYTCTNCPKTFSKKSQLTYHAAGHSDERKFPCNTCGKRFKRRKQLVVHARAHTDVRPFACDKCNMRFKLKSVLVGHMKVHDGEKQYLCYYCGASFAQSGNLEVHMRKHTGEKPFACTECNFRAAVASNLHRHQRRHRAERPFVCKHCNKGFYDASGLVRHSRTHSGAAPYKCPCCSRTFADSWKRKAHLMRAHRLALQHIPRMRRDGTYITT